MKANEKPWKNFQSGADIIFFIKSSQDTLKIKLQQGKVEPETCLESVAFVLVRDDDGGPAKGWVVKMETCDTFEMCFGSRNRGTF